MSFTISKFPLYIATFVVLMLMSCEQAEWRKRGQSALEIGDYSRAAQAWAHVLDAQPADAEARYGLAMALFSSARQMDQERRASAPMWDSCWHEFQILLRLDSSRTVKAMASTSAFQVAKNQVESEQYSQASMLLRRSIALDSSNWFAWNLQGLALEGLGQSAQAQIAYETVVAKEPSIIAAYVNYGNLQWRQGHIAEAWEIWSLGLERDSTNAYLQYWVSLAERKLKEDALRD